MVAGERCGYHSYHSDHSVHGDAVSGLVGRYL